MGPRTWKSTPVVPVPQLPTVSAVVPVPSTRIARPVVMYRSVPSVRLPEMFGLPSCGDGGASSTYGVEQELVQGLKVVPEGHAKLVTQVELLEHHVVPLGHEQVNVEQLNS